MRRIALLICLTSLLAALPAAAADSAAKIGISDQQASTFANPLYAPLKLKIARYIAPYDVMSDPDQLARFKAWYAGATAQKQQILVAFEHTYKSISGKKKAPTVAAYTKAIKAFGKAYPKVKDIQPWNEANRCQRTLEDGNVIGQPICRNPKRAAEYYSAARKVFAGARVTGLDILDQNNVKSSVKYVKDFLKYAKPRPKYWGIHNYSDTNRFSTTRTKALLEATGSGEVWLTETGGLVSFGESFPYDEDRAAKALGCMFTLAKTFSRIKRVYVYHFNGLEEGNEFDAGLLNADGSPRPGYGVVKSRKARACRK